MISKRNLQDVMFIRNLPVRNAGQDFIAAVDAMRITLYSMVISIKHMSCLARFRESVLNVQF